MDPFNDLKLGEQLHGYTVDRIEALPDLEATFYALSHISGAQHVHIARNDDNNTFSVFCPTVPQDSSGVAHILEHMVLSGSQKYPLKSPFFAMLPRSLNTFMNAFTAADWTMYPFSTRNTQDFYNLLSVYLDAVYFPLLTEWTFKREAHRLEYVDDKLTIQGVVYNEMKGAMANASAVMNGLLGKAIYPDLTYANNSGGDPAYIPDLTWQQLKDFHAKHYHPSNSYFYSYGNLPLRDILAQIDQLALSQFEALPSDQRIQIPDQPRFDAPRHIQAHYPNDNTQNQDQVALAWLNVPSTDSLQTLTLNVLESALMGNAASPLRQALIDSGLGSTLANGSGYHTSYRESSFVIGLKNTSVAHADTIEKLILDTLENIAQTGLPAELIDSVLHQIELHHKEVSNSGYPYSLKLFFSFANVWFYGEDPLRALQFEQDLQTLAQLRQQEGFFESLIRHHWLDNPHRVRVELVADATLADQQQQAEQNRIAAIESSLDELDRTRILADSATLAQLQEHSDNVDILPTLRPQDINLKVPVVPYQHQSLSHVEVGLCPQPTNGLIYIDIELDTGHLSAEQKQLLPFFSYALNKSGAAQRDYLQMARWLEACTGGVYSSASISSKPQDIDSSYQEFSLGGSALLRNSTHLIEILRDFLASPTFDEGCLLQLLKQRRSAMESSVVSAGHQYAASLANAQLSPIAALREQFNGLSQLTYLKALDDDTSLLKTEFDALAAALRHGKAYICVTAEQSTLDQLDISPIVSVLGGQTAGNSLPHPLPHTPQARTTTVPVSYNAQAFRTVPYTHPDAPVLLVLAQLLRANILLPEIREKGGAYGGFASADIQTGLFTLLSYRDPHISRTFSVYREAIERAQNHLFSQRELDEAIISAGGALDPLTSPNSLGSKRFFGDLRGYNSDIQEAFRALLPQIRPTDIQRVAQQYFQFENSSLATITSQNQLDQASSQLSWNFESQSI